MASVSVSQVAREALAVNARITFDPNQCPHGQDDVRSTQQTHTSLIALLDELLEHCPRPILVTAVRRDHHDDSALGPHGHWGSQAGPGFAADLWNRDYTDLSIGDAGVEDVIDSLLQNSWCHSIGLAGYAQRFFDSAKAKAPPGVVVFLDNGGDHIHAASNGVQCA